MATARRVGDELCQQPLAVPLAHARFPGQAGPGGGPAGLDLRFVGRSDPGLCAYLDILVRGGWLGCPLIARRVRVCGFGAGLLCGHRFVLVAGRLPPAGLLHEQVGGW